MAAVEKKSAALNIRVRPSTIALAKKRAQQEDRSVASYIERLILADAEKAKGAKPK